MIYIKIFMVNYFLVIFLDYYLSLKYKEATIIFFQKILHF